MLYLYILGKIILYILLVLLSTVTAVLLAALFIPFKYYFNGSKEETATFYGYIAWLFGGVKIKFIYNSETGSNVMISILGMKKQLENKKGNKQVGSHQTAPEKSKDKQKNPYSYFNRAILEKGIETVLKLINHCKPGQLELNAKLGFEDPMYTGLLYGINGAGYAILNKLNIHLEPTFEEEEFEGNFTVAGRIQIIYLIVVALGFFLAKPFRSVFIKNIKIKLKRRIKTWRTLILKKT